MLANRLALARLFSANIIAILLIISMGVKIFGGHYFLPSNQKPNYFLKIYPEKMNISGVNNLSAKPEADKKINNSLTEMDTVETQMPLTTLELLLVGVLINNNDEHSAQAIISVNNAQKSYALNAQLPVPGNVALLNIARDYVVLNNNGHKELLRLYDGILETNNSILPLDISKETLFIYGRIPGADEPPPYIPNEKYEEASLAEISHKFAGLMNMGIQRNDSNKQLIGYKINPTQDINKFITAGLQNGDMITAINGVPITKPEEILDSYENLESETVALEIERDGKVVNLEVSRVF